MKPLAFLLSWIVCGAIASLGMEANKCAMVHAKAKRWPSLYEGKDGENWAHLAAFRAEDEVGLVFVMGPIGLAVTAAGTNLFSHGFNRGCLIEIQRNGLKSEAK